MKCPHCQQENTKVVDSRQKGERRHRRRQCDDCGHRFSTTEVPGTVDEQLPLLPPMVQKISGKMQRFDRVKLMQSIAVAVRKSQRGNVPIDEIVDSIEQDISTSPDATATSAAIGEQVLAALHKHDRLAYVRYLSVHRQIKTGADVQQLIDALTTLLDADEQRDSKDNKHND